MRVHVDGTFLVLRVVSAVMKRQEGRLVDHNDPKRGISRGTIAVMGSGAGFLATPAMVQYTTAKHAVMGLVKTAGRPIPKREWGSFECIMCCSCADIHATQLWTMPNTAFELTRPVLHGLKLL